MSPRHIFFAAVIAGLSMSTAQAAVTVTVFDPDTYTENHGDPFDLAQGASITGSVNCCAFGAVFAENAIGGNHVAPNGEGGAVFDDGIASSGSISFQTAAPVTIAGFNLFLAEDPAWNGSIRHFTSVGLRGSLDNVTFDDLGQATLAGPTYLAAYGSPYLRVTSTFAPAAYRFFRLEVTYPAGVPFNGGRVLELDGIRAVDVVPEPASWALMLTGFGLLGMGLRHSPQRNSGARRMAEPLARFGTGARQCACVTASSR